MSTSFQKAAQNTNAMQMCLTTEAQHTQHISLLAAVEWDYESHSRPLL